MPACFGTRLDSDVFHDTVHDILGVAARLFTTRVVAVSRIEGPTCTVTAIHDQQRQLRPGILLKLGTYGFLRYGLHLFPEASLYFAPTLITLGAIGITMLFRVGL